MLIYTQGLNIWSLFKTLYVTPTEKNFNYFYYLFSFQLTFAFLSYYRLMFVSHQNCRNYHLFIKLTCVGATITIKLLLVSFPLNTSVLMGISNHCGQIESACKSKNCSFDAYNFLVYFFNSDVYHLLSYRRSFSVSLVIELKGKTNMPMTHVQLYNSFTLFCSLRLDFIFLVISMGLDISLEIIAPKM